MNKTVFFALMALVSYSFHSYAQTQLAEGYVITHNNDTVKGQIKFIDDNTNSKVCTFTDATTNQTFNYKPGEIAGYRFTDGNYYVTRQITIDKDSLLAFLEFIVDGEIDLYYYGGVNYPVYFIQKPNEKLFMIKGGEKDIKRYGEETDVLKKTYRVDNNQYKGALVYYLQDLPEIQKKAYATDLNHKELTNLAVEYHEYKCTDKECIVYEKKESKRVRYGIGVLGGLNVQNIYEESKGIEPYEYQTMGSLFGLQGDLFYGKNQAHMFSSLRILYGTSNYSKDDLKYNESFMGMGLSLNYKFLKYKFSPFAGFALEFTKHNCHYDNLLDVKPYDVDLKKSLFSSKLSGGVYWQTSERIYVKAQVDYSLPLLRGEYNNSEYVFYTETKVFTSILQINYLF